MTMDDDRGAPRSLPTSPASKSPTVRSQRSQGIMSSAEADHHGAPRNAGMSGLLAERMAEGGGALCNDENGLCLGVQGNIDASRSGVYTSIAKLASLLDNTVDGTGGQHQEVPLVSIQTDKSALLVKEYGGRTVVFRVPTEAEASAAPGDEGQGVEKDAA